MRYNKTKMKYSQVPDIEVIDENDVIDDVYEKDHLLPKRRICCISISNDTNLTSDVFLADSNSNSITTTATTTTTTTNPTTVKMVKIFILSCLLVATFHAVSAWIVTPKSQLQRAAAMIAISTSIATAPLVANAHDFTGSYADPKHPNCLREVVVVGKSADVSGTDGTPGCPADGSGKKWDLKGEVDGNSIKVDFTPKGGPANLKGVWESSPVPGIRWPDNNLWSLKDMSMSS